MVPLYVNVCDVDVFITDNRDWSVFKKLQTLWKTDGANLEKSVALQA